MELAAVYHLNRFVNMNNKLNWGFFSTLCVSKKPKEEMYSMNGVSSPLTIAKHIIRFQLLLVLYY